MNDDDTTAREMRRLWAIKDVLLSEIERIAGCDNCERYAYGYAEHCERSGDGPEECDHDVCLDEGCEIVLDYPPHIVASLSALSDSRLDGPDVRRPFQKLAEGEHPSEP